MRAPAFWNRHPPDWRARLLYPLGALYARATETRVRSAPSLLPGIPVICVGNLSAGGTGKTPTAIALAEHLTTLGMTAAIVSRGYGGALEGPVRVDPAIHSAGDVGDEPLLAAAFATVWMGKDRAEAAARAEADGADILILDDGFQNPSIRKDLSLVVVDARVGFGNGLPIPAGPLRERIDAGLSRADAVLAIGEHPDTKRFSAEWRDRTRCPILTAQLEPLPTGLPLRDLKVVAFAGIGRPSKFFDTLRAQGANVVREIPLGDHQPISSALIRRILAEGKDAGAQIVTTEKDAVRLPASARHRVMTVPVRLRFDDPGAFAELIHPLLAPNRRS